MSATVPRWDGIQHSVIVWSPVTCHLDDRQPGDKVSSRATVKWLTKITISKSKADPNLNPNFCRPADSCPVDVLPG